jgi:hypothetical protein
VTDLVDAPTGEATSDGRSGPDQPPRSDLVVKVAVVLTLGVAIWLRFWTPSALWLDEALTVNIAQAPLHEIPSLLRDDGAPPLYYYLLHFWMDLFGHGNLAARSLAGVIGVINLPVAWVAGYRVGSRWWSLDAVPAGERAVRLERGRMTAWAVTLLMAMSPFAVYYDTEARMYGLLILLGTLTVLSLISLLRRPTLWNAAGLALIVSTSLYTHYWSLYSTAVITAGAAWSVWKGPYRLSCRFVLGAVVAAGLSFLPWLQTLWFQTEHTGTPWAGRAQLSAVVYTFTQFGGGASDFGRGLTAVFFLCAVLAVFGTPLRRWLVVLDIRTRPGVRALAVGVLATLVLGILAGRIGHSTFADRYTSIVFFPALVIVAYGVTTIGDRRTRTGLLAVAIVLGFLAAIPNSYISRTAAGAVGAAILAEAHQGDVIAFCPDQLGPAVSRVLDDRFNEITFPRGAPPEIVNWVNYLQVVKAASPASFVHHVEALAGPSGTVFYDWAPYSNGFGNKCQAMQSDFANWPGHRLDVVVEALKADTAFEIDEGSVLVAVRPT